MKIGTLQSIAHNIADSVGSGIGLMIGVYTINIFQEASWSRSGYLLVDFLTGRTWGGVPSHPLARAIKLYRDALPQLCAKHGASREDFRELTARYSITNRENHIVVAIRDSRGRRRVRECVGSPARRVRVLDRLGGIRTNSNVLRRGAYRTPAAWEFVMAGRSV
jgi:hypothetical protein